jgi:hypothetical protein
VYQRWLFLRRTVQQMVLTFTVSRDSCAGAIILAHMLYVSAMPYIPFLSWECYPASLIGIAIRLMYYATYTSNLTQSLEDDYD